MEVEDMQRPCERMAHRSGQNVPQRLLLPLQKTRSCGFCNKPHLPVAPAAAKAPTAQLTDKPAQASAIKAPTTEAIDKPDTASAAEAPTTDVQAGS